MKNGIQQNGYMIQLYQYARRYRYNHEGCIEYFNYLIDSPNHNKNFSNGLNEKGERGSNNAYMVFGDFDMLEIIPVDSFRKYHDVSNLAKKYLGRRQNVLLYCIDDILEPSRIQYNCEYKMWCDTKGEIIRKRFFCLSMLSITNEAHASFEIFALLPQIRRHILTLINSLNGKLTDAESLVCEVYGALNATEIGIVWICNQYVDVLTILDYLKHMKIYSSADEVAGKVPLFLASNTTIATKLDVDFKEIDSDLVRSFQEVNGSAYVQFSVHDKLESHEEADELFDTIMGKIKMDTSECKALYSSGEYDFVIQMPASYALKLMQKGGILNNAERDKKGYYIKELRSILRNNTQLLLDRDDNGNVKLKNILETLEISINVSEGYVQRNTQDSEREWMELVDPEFYCARNGIKEGNNAYYKSIRMEMEKMIPPSAGAIDMLDLLYADYLSILATAYNQTWVSDFHHQFKAVLHAIRLWLLNQKNMGHECEGDAWENFRDLTNAFKQQIYHLSQSSRMVLDIPRCHFRMTGQYDLLVHTYYGFTKIILETIYYMQGNEKQSELIPLITVNTVPQVTSELYFEYGNTDGMRAINLNIPASVIFDPCRGIRYLTHELFHYVAPQSRKKRNYYMGCFIISECFKMQFIHIFNRMLCTSIQGTIDSDLEEIFQGNKDAFGLTRLTQCIFFNEYSDDNKEEYGKYWLDNEILSFVMKHTWKWWCGELSGDTDTCTDYQKKIFDYCMSMESDKIFIELCFYLMECAYGKFQSAFSKERRNKTFECIERNLKPADKISPEALRILSDRFTYCMVHKQYSFLQFSGMRRDYANDEEIGNVVGKILWNTVREASCDIAMVSLTSMEPEDYLLFCIQAWRDSNCGEFDNSMIEEDQCLRCGLVLKYFTIKKWNSMDSEDIKKRFLKKYVWFFARKRGISGDIKNEEDNKKIIYEIALKWWDFFKFKCINEFHTEDAGKKHFYYFTFYDTIFANIISDFDIEEKFNIVNGGKRIQEIHDDIRLNIVKKYDELIYDLVLDESEDGFTWDLQEVEKYCKARFQQDLAVAQSFQKQKSFEELAQINIEVQKNKNNLKCWRPDIFSRKRNSISSEIFWEFHVRSLEELLFYMQYCEEKIQNGNLKEPIWFRGQSNETFQLVPSIMRRYDREKQMEFESLRAYQQCEFEEFKYRADGAPEIPSGVYFTCSDYIALMQHYFVPTTFLDWSENAFSALYFALEHYFEDDGEKNDVALYLFKAKGYNSICYKKSKNAVEQSGEINEDIFKWISKKVPSWKHWIDNTIPNLSIESNAINFSAYLLGNREFDGQFVAQKCKDLKRYDEIRKNAVDLCLPLAVWTSRLNTRIRTQSGCFVAYNLYTMPELDKQDDIGKNCAFDYISLETIQKDILEKDFKEENIFLYKIIIDQKCCNMVMEWLRGMGISRSSVYPELELLKKRF